MNTTSVTKFGLLVGKIRQGWLCFSVDPNKDLEKIILQFEERRNISQLLKSKTIIIISDRVISKGDLTILQCSDIDFNIYVKMRTTKEAIFIQQTTTEEATE